jgi:hypothetical protein
MAGAEPAAVDRHLQGALRELRDHARRYHRLDLWWRHEGREEPVLRGHEYGLVDGKRRAVFLCDSLDELRRRMRVGCPASMPTELALSGLGPGR